MITGQIFLEGLRFNCCHGCLPQERITPNLFVVDFEGDADITAAVQSDDLKDTIDYSTIYDIIASRMGTPANLLEHLCGDIVQAIAEALPGLVRFSVRVSKHEPPVDGEAEWSRVRIEYHR